MRVVVRIVVGYMLSLLLLGTSPAGTGQGVHANQLLDSIFPHVHVIDGQIVPAGQVPQATAVDTQPAHGPVLGAGSGATATTSALGLTPPVPINALRMIGRSERYQRFISDDALPRATVNIPPDPPPTA